MRLKVTELDDVIGGMEYLARLALKSSESSFEMCCYGRMQGVVKVAVVMMISSGQCVSVFVTTDCVSRVPDIE